jgi:hypothetical protein
VQSSVAAIPEAERRFGPLAEPKAIIHTWLAWQKEPGKPLGTAITARFLDPNVAEVADALQISFETVKEHVQHVLGKIGASERTQSPMRAAHKQRT